MTFAILSHFRSKNKQKAIEVWNNHLYWSNNELAQAVDDNAMKKGAPFHLLNFGGSRKAAIDDVGHLSVFRALGRHKVADYWAPMLQRDGVSSAFRVRNQSGQQLAHWGHIEHDRFWQEAAKVFAGSNTNYWPHVLGTAACAGNLVPFQTCPKNELVGQAQVMAHWGATPNQGLVHPDVALWLVHEGLWDQSIIEQQVSPSNFPLDGSLGRFMGLTHNVQCESRYVQELCTKVLKHYSLTKANTIRFVGQAMMSFNPEEWENFLEPVIVPYLDGIDLSVLKAVCGQSTFCRKPGEAELLNTLYKATQAAMFPYRAEYANTGMRQGPGQHEGLLLLMDVAPPCDRLELYFLGERAMRIERGVDPVVDTWPMPTLD